MSFTIKDIIAGQPTKSIKSFNTDLFASDREHIEFDKQAYSEFWLVDTNAMYEQNGNDKLIETVVAVGYESDFYMITAITTSFNGETQVNYTQQDLTLKGFNYFTKNVEDDLTEVYNNYLAFKGYEITLDDIREFGELNTQYDVVTLQFTDKNENKHYLTVNNRNQLSSITKKPALQAKRVSPKIQSAFS